jgi:predicted transcriptional regulator
MLSTGNQLRAARALVDMDQGALAKVADVSVNTIRNMEASKEGTINANNHTVVAVQKALEKAGIEFLNHDQPGVRLKPRGAAKS